MAFCCLVMVFWVWQLQPQLACEGKGDPMHASASFRLRLFACVHGRSAHVCTPSCTPSIAGARPAGCSSFLRCSRYRGICEGCCPALLGACRLPDGGFLLWSNACNASNAAPWFCQGALGVCGTLPSLLSLHWFLSLRILLMSGIERACYLCWQMHGGMWLRKLTEGIRCGAFCNVWRWFDGYALQL